MLWRLSGLSATCAPACRPRGDYCELRRESISAVAKPTLGSEATVFGLGCHGKADRPIRVWVPTWPDRRPERRFMEAVYCALSGAVQEFLGGLNSLLVDGGVQSEMV
jgi:hypothetical protein